MKARRFIILLLSLGISTTVISVQGSTSSGEIEKVKRDKFTEAEWKEKAYTIEFNATQNKELTGAEYSAIRVTILQPINRREREKAGSKTQNGSQSNTGLAESADDRSNTNKSPSSGRRRSSSVLTFETKHYNVRSILHSLRKRQTGEGERGVIPVADTPKSNITVASGLQERGVVPAAKPTPNIAVATVITETNPTSERGTIPAVDPGSPTTEAPEEPPVTSVMAWKIWVPIVIALLLLILLLLIFLCCRRKKRSKTLPITPKRPPSDDGDSIRDCKVPLTSQTPPNGAPPGIRQLEDNGGYIVPLEQLTDDEKPMLSFRV